MKTWNTFFSGTKATYDRNQPLENIPIEMAPAQGFSWPELCWTIEKWDPAAGMSPRSTAMIIILDHTSSGMCPIWFVLRTSTVVDKKRHGTEPLRLLTRSNLHDLVYGSMLRTRLLSITCTNIRTRRKKNEIRSIPNWLFTIGFITFPSYSLPPMNKHPWNKIKGLVLLEYPTGSYYNNARKKQIQNFTKLI